MQTISQVAKLTGISTRTLQYYDEIGLLKPSELTSSGYRLYDDAALQKLQQILFFKELDFKLKDIKEILENPEFDLSDYVQALEDFKNSNTDSVMKHWGSIENFNLFIQKVKDDEDEVAKLAIKQFGSVEKYTEAMKYNLEHFSEIMEEQLSKIPKDFIQQSDDLYQRLTADLKKDISSDEIQQIVHEIRTFMLDHSTMDLLGNDYWNRIIDTYSNDYIRAVNDTKYGEGASDYIANAFRYYGAHHNSESD